MRGIFISKFKLCIVPAPMSLFDQKESHRPMVMGILNITPDSFSDGGELYRQGSSQLDSVLNKAEQMLKSGADILDVGGESTRPGAIRPSAQEELDRVGPAVEALSQNFQCSISVDTSRAEVMQQVLDSGAAMINDVRALTEPGTLELVAERDAAVCLMHMQGTPRTMQEDPVYTDVVSEVSAFLTERLEACISAGVSRANICLDPGFGFGKSFEHNMTLMAGLPMLSDLGLPILVGVSRKGMIGEITKKPIESRLAGSLAMAQEALNLGAKILRVHDVPETCDMIRTWTAVKNKTAEYKSE